MVSGDCPGMSKGLLLMRGRAEINENREFYPSLKTSPTSTEADNDTPYSLFVFDLGPACVQELSGACTSCCTRGLHHDRRGRAVYTLYYTHHTEIHQVGSVPFCQRPHHINHKQEVSSTKIVAAGCTTHIETGSIVIIESPARIINISDSRRSSSNPPATRHTK